MANTFSVGSLAVQVYETRALMAAAAARDIEDAVAATIAERGRCNIIFAAAPSQSDTLAALAASPRIRWQSVHAFHMDEYVGLAADAPQGFGNFLRAALFDALPFGSVHLLDGTADPAVEATRYAALLRQNPPDVVVMGIGENGHIAFNDPPVADFDDPALVKLVELEAACRAQQVHDGCFASLDEVPTTALTLTVPALVRAGRAFCVVPGKTKARAVYNTLNGPISESCPASVLRRHPAARLYLDADSAGKE